MVRVSCPLEVGQVASDAGCRRPLVSAADMASGAVESGMHAGQREAGVSQMIKLRAQPGVDGMALFALC